MPRAAERNMKRSGITLVARSLWSLPVLCAGVFWLGCETRTEIPELENRPLNAQMENSPESLKIIRKDAFPWHNVTFLLNKRYEYQVEICDQPEIVIPYDRFRTPDGQIYDPSVERLFRVHIYADEGRWPHDAAHN
jgi:hypothetical protein